MFVMDLPRCLFFEGSTASSKSMMNRALILKSFSPDLNIQGFSRSQDVLNLEKSLQGIAAQNEFFVGDGGTSFRFLLARLSRRPGKYLIQGSLRLLSRPHQELFSILKEFGIHCEKKSNGIEVSGQGWSQPQSPVFLNCQESSQYLSALLLAAVDLDFDLKIAVTGEFVSESYFLMTLQMMKQVGIEAFWDGKNLLVPKGQKIKKNSIDIEPDLSSIFTLAAVAVFQGGACFKKFPQQSLQPDASMVGILQMMSCQVFFHGDDLFVLPPKNFSDAGFKNIEVNLKQAPDLFPVLAALCVFADGVSVLRGAPQLRHKESDRIGKVADLLRKLSVEVTEHEDGISILGKGRNFSAGPITFDVDHDHRLAMMLAVLNSGGCQILANDPAVLEKSLPELQNFLQHKYFLIGHRGVGKTTFAKILSQKKNYAAIDLDKNIEEISGQKIEDIFALQGEESFRQSEGKALQKLLEQDFKKETLIVVGAGAAVQLLKSENSIWISRRSDQQGRVFTDRPRLRHQENPLQEFLGIKTNRDLQYLEFSKRSVELPEGEYWRSKNYLLNIIKQWDRDWAQALGVFTLSRNFLNCLIPFGPELYELRTDLLSENELREFLIRLPEEKILFSVRNATAADDLNALPENFKGWIDYDIQFYKNQRILGQTQNLIFSTHQSDFDLALQELKNFEKKIQLRNANFKLCPIVENFLQLEKGFSWWKEDPEHRSFLPRSGDGRWAWFRLYMKGRQKLNFWREGAGILDQPSLCEWLMSPLAPVEFAAVLGNPIQHSWSPVEHADFFQSLPFWKIQIEASEWPGTIIFLRQLGLKFAAVTSPFKKQAFDLVKNNSAPQDLLSSKGGSCNTLFFGSDILGTNTDLSALKKILQIYFDISTAVWGGGALVSALQSILPKAQFYSSTQACERSSGISAADCASPQILIWSAPRGDSLQMPPAHWQPETVYDLNYAENSAGREYALLCKAKYVSGAEFFREQAKLQQEFWQANEK